ncbi:2,3-bisphosphoglycerate-independent phosphoglycerate mutase [Candidatus Saccharibacteria bacterium]|nr:2,3-bisphosphoglycerate-independent phosphoglycerate mutase [Candidatus Saccharibacteria bacterium]
METANPKVVLLVMDGIGLRDSEVGNAVKLARTPNLIRLWAEGVGTTLGASGAYVGMDNGEQGNSEVGHLALGTGQILAQDARRVDEWLGLLDKPSELPNSPAWQEIVARLTTNDVSATANSTATATGGVSPTPRTLHVSGIFADGRVHSDVKHFYAILDQAAKSGIPRLRLHLLTDGKDVPPQSALEYVDKVEAVFADYNRQGFDYAIADGGGREVIICDRYYSNIGWVEKGYNLWVHGQNSPDEPARAFKSVREAIETYRAEDPEQQDQFMPTFVIGETDAQVAAGRIRDGDALVFFNFRADRAIEISEVFDSPKGWYDRFDISDRPDILFVGLMHYDPDRNIPSRFFMQKPEYHNVLAEILERAGKKSFAVSESWKFGHVTFYWDGLKSAPYFGETVVDIPATETPFTDRPWMKSAEITDELIKALDGGQFDFLRANYPNGDMVGHSSELDPTIIAVEAVDLAVGRVMAACKNSGAILLVTADHGKAEELVYPDGTPMAPHTLNRVPFTVWTYPGGARWSQDETCGLANVAATVASLLGVQPNPSWQKSLIKG